MGRGNKFTGKVGERISSEFLKKRGYKILETNFRTPFGEIDMIARQGGSIVFLEVKTRMTDSLGPPYISVTKLKQRHIVKNALVYLKRYGLVDSSWRVDIVSVKLDHRYEADRIEIMENAIEGW